MTKAPFYILRRSETEIYIIRFDGAFVPEDEQNVDYQKYQAWITEGNEPEEWDPDASN